MSDFVDAAVRIAAQRRSGHVRYQIEYLLESCQSPIEEKLGAALFATDAAALCFVSVLTHENEWDHHGFYIIPQMPVRTYRADFGLILKHHMGTHRLVVECDGHEFHEKDKIRAARDKARDRDFLEDGWPVMRFTGSEIHRNAMKCADQAGDFLMDHLIRAHGKEPRVRN